jgi:hypothetical protein
VFQKCRLNRLTALTFAHALAQAEAGQGSQSGGIYRQAGFGYSQCEEIEPDPVQYVPAWHRLQATEVEAPAHSPSDAESMHSPET